MADRSEVDGWERVHRWSNRAIVVSILLLLPVMVFMNGNFDGPQFWLVWPLIFSVVVGVYCNLKHFNAFIDYELSKGTSVEVARQKWNDMYPSGADG